MLEESIINKLESLRLRSAEIHEALAQEGATDNMAHFTQRQKRFTENIFSIPRYQQERRHHRGSSQPTNMLRAGRSVKNETTKTN